MRSGEEEVEEEEEEKDPFAPSEVRAEGEEREVADGDCSCVGDCIVVADAGDIAAVFAVLIA